MGIRGFKPPYVDIIENRQYVYPLVDKLKTESDKINERYSSNK